MHPTSLFAWGFLTIATTAVGYMDGHDFHMTCRNYTTGFSNYLILEAACPWYPTYFDAPSTNTTTNTTHPPHVEWRQTSLDLNKCIWYDSAKKTRSMQWIAPTCSMQLPDMPLDLRNHSAT